MRSLIKISALAALLLAACRGPDEYFWGSFPDAGGFDRLPLAGHGGTTTGTGGTVTGTGGLPTGLGGTPAGTAGTTGSAGSVGTGNAGSGGTPVGTAGTTGSGGATGRGGNPGSAGAAGMAGSFGRGGIGGATGMAGAVGGAGTTGSAGATGAGGTVGRGGTTGAAGTTGRGGTTGSAGTTGTAGATGTVLYSEDFESESAGATAATDWSRTGGSSSDWTIATDGTKVFEQTGATSSTIRIQALTGAGASGSPWSGALSVSARVKLLMPGSSNQAALLCVRYNDTSNRYCAALLPNGVQIQTAVGGSTGASAVFTATVATGTFYDLRLGVDASNVLTVSLGGTQRGTYTPGTMTNGTVAIGTTSMEAAFDSIAVTRP